jgi:RimJ/RimL family protein N-acetyltransferase
LDVKSTEVPRVLGDPPRLADDKGPGYAARVRSAAEGIERVCVLPETERLVLRRFTEADADDLSDLDGDPEVMRFITGGQPTPREVILNQTLPRMLRYDGRSEGFGFWAAIEKSTGGFLGWFEFRPPVGGDEAELGYRLKRAAWGTGYATEGARALIRKGFAELGVRRVFAQTMAVNTASRRVMEKAGLAHVRIFHEDWPDPIEGAEHGEVEYSLTKADWGRQEAVGRE